jgi:hypothetical protein
MQDWCCIGGETHLVSAFVNSCINKTLPPHVRLPSFDSLCPKYSGHDGSIAEHMYMARLALLGVVRLDASQELRFGLSTTVVLTQYNLIVEEYVQRPSVPELIRLIPGLLQGDDFRFKGMALSRCEQGRRARKRHPETTQSHAVQASRMQYMETIIHSSSDGADSCQLLAPSSSG